MNASYADFQQMLAKYTDRDGVLVVGHNPNLFQFIGRLITGNGGAAIRMRKGSIACVRADSHPPQLQCRFHLSVASRLLPLRTM